MTKLHATFHQRIFHFKNPSGTSRGVLREKQSWFIELSDPERPEIKGIGECSVISGLSPDFTSIEQYEAKLNEVCADLNTDLKGFPSIRFGLETAMLDLQNGGRRIYFDNDFSKGNIQIPINGLIWMGDEPFMKAQIEEKIAAGFRTIKMKIGAIDFDAEYALLKSIRDNYSSEQITLRVDANGAFSSANVLGFLEKLSELNIHSIEQPIAAGNWTEMAELCRKSPIAIALDEELIGIDGIEQKRELLTSIQPQYVILKPSLHGGIAGTREWIELANSMNIGWWITSALESNIGLNAIAQFTAEYNISLPQGLGTGSLYVDNIVSNLRIENGHLLLRTENA